MFSSYFGPILAAILSVCTFYATYRFRKHIHTAEDIAPVNMEFQDVQFVAEGIVESVFHQSGLNDLMECVANPHDLSIDLKQATNHLNHNDIESVMRGMHDVGEALHILIDAVEQCHPEVDPDTLENLRDMTDHMKSENKFELMYKFGEDMLVNGVSIWHEIGDARKQIQKKNWRQFGRNIGEALQLVFRAEDAEGYVKLRDVVLQLSKGILEGALDAEGLDSLDQCMDGGFEIFYDFKTSVEILAQANPMTIFDGIKGIQGSVHNMTQHFMSCSQVEADYDRLAYVAKKMEHGQEFAYEVGQHIIVDGVDIYHHINDAIKFWNNKQFEPFGKEIGIIIKTVFLGNEDNSDPAKVMVGTSDEIKEEMDFYMALYNKSNRKYDLPKKIAKKPITGLGDTMNIVLDEKNFKKIEGAKEFEGLNYDQVMDKIEEIQKDDDEFFDALEYHDDERFHDTY